MRIFKLAAVFTAIVGASSAAVAQTPGGASRPSMMVMNFEFATVSDQLKEKESIGSVIAAFRGQNPNANVEQTKVDLGAGISDMVVERLLEDGGFRILERKALEKVFEEQRLTNSSAAAPSQGDVAKQAAILGAKYMLTGSITKFGSEETTRGVALGGLGIPGVGGIGKKSRKTEVAITARLVDTSTGEIVASIKGEGVSTKGGGFALAGGGLLGGVAMGSNSSNVRESAIGEATELAVTQLIANLGAKKAQIN